MFRASARTSACRTRTKLSDAGQQPRDHRDPGRPPAIRVDGVPEAPGDVGAVRPVETHVQAVLPLEPMHQFVVGGRGLQLLGRVQLPDVGQTTKWQPPHARHAFVGGIVVLEVLALQVLVPPSPAVGPDEESPNVVPGTLADHDGIARQSAGLVDLGRGGRPAGHRPSMASYTDARTRSNASWSLKTISPLSSAHRGNGAPRDSAAPGSASCRSLRSFPPSRSPRPPARTTGARAYRIATNSYPSILMAWSVKAVMYSESFAPLAGKPAGKRAGNTAGSSLTDTTGR